MNPCIEKSIMHIVNVPAFIPDVTAMHSSVIANKYLFKNFYACLKMDVVLKHGGSGGM